MINLSLILFFIGLLSEFYLLYLNYLARVRYKQYFVEMNPTWRWFDKRGLAHLSLFFGFLLSFCVLILVGPVFVNSLIGFLASDSLLGFFVGSIVTNTLFDSITFRRRYLCIKLRCNKVEEVAKCTRCSLQEEYGVSLITLSIYKNKYETNYRQRYDHLIEFFKWLLDKVRRK